MPLRLLTLLALLVPTLAFAYPSQVRDMLQHAGQTFVARAPGTIDDATKHEIEAIAQATAAKTGGKVYIIIDNKTAPSEYDRLYTDLGLTGHDVVVASNGPGWSLQVGSLSAQQKQDILNRVGLAGGKPLDKLKTLTDDVQRALAQTKAVTHTTTSAGTLAPAPTPASSGGHGGLIFLGVVVAIIGAVVFFRRKKRDASLTADFQAALQPPTRIMTDVYMGLDGLEHHPDFGTLMDRATAVQSKIDAVKGQAPSREAIARLDALTADANQVRLAFDQAKRTLK